MIKLASWNVNSIKVRIEQVLQWFESSKTDVLALQETKIIDEQFPLEAIQDLGFHVVCSGQKTYNGVAIISRYPITDVVTDLPHWADSQRRILAATIAGIRIFNLYVPNGAAIGTDKYAYKLQWLENVTGYLQEQISQYPLLAVVGDFNIAPEDIDVHDPNAWLGSVLVSPAERAAFLKWLALGLKDSFRHCNKDVQAFSWWDYRAGSFRRNHGLRIDHILLSDALHVHCRESHIDIEPRRVDRPSDHTPVWATLDINL